jgi:hypothetical protein
MRLPRSSRRFPFPVLRLTSSVFGLVAQGVAWAGAIIAVFFVTSKMPSLFQRIPPEIQFVCEALIVLAAVLLFRLLFERQRTLRAYAQLTDTLGRFHPATRLERASGVSSEKMDQVRAACEDLTGSPCEWWLTVDEALEYYESSEGEGGWFLTRPVREILPEDELIAPFYHASFHQAVPGILTALGLLATFSAILVALSGVSYNTANAAQPVTGIDSLINGLAGKFLSSIIALILGMIFTFVEKKACERRILREVDALRNLIARIFPFLSQTRILLDLQRIARASRLLPLEAEKKPIETPVEHSAAQEPRFQPRQIPEIPETLAEPAAAATALLTPEPTAERPATSPEEGGQLAAQFGI